MGQVFSTLDALAYRFAPLLLEGLRRAWGVVTHYWPSSTEAAIRPNRLYLIAKKDIRASP
jgi:hypothetical protein